MDFFEVLKTRRSIRAYKPDTVPENLLAKVLEATRVAPSGSNRQPWKFIVVRNPALRKDLSAACGNQAFLAEAPLAIVGCGRNIKFDRGGYMGDMSMLVDVSIAFTHLILAARAEGLGTCWIGAFDNRTVKQLLGVPREWDVVAVTPLGYPAGDEFRETEKRKKLDDIVSYDAY
jgi:nitroreductase